MRMDGQDESSNVEDARDSGGGRGGGGLRLGGGVGVGTIVIAVVAGWIFGINPLTVLGLLGGGGSAPMTQSAPNPAGKPPANDPQAQFVSQVLRSTEVVWAKVFSESGKTYVNPKLTLFRGSYPTGCGQGDAAMGPFYCPADSHVYLDMAFFDTMSKRLGAPGQFAQAYVIGHEVAHHVQNQLGISGKVDAMRARSSETQQNAASVRLELQADCFAGVWANRSQAEQGWKLEPGDVEAALNAASQIGDDTLQRKSRGQVVPESFTHGTSAQRVNWFKRGLQSGSPAQCNTFE
ncbi:MAG: neutral zinc metallopeptidase [Pseudorhodobacter sp.]|nr:neutral zinc metallopeptidase [Rhizobacter sp.]